MGKSGRGLYPVHLMNYLFILFYFAYTSFEGQRPLAFLPLLLILSFILVSQLRLLLRRPVAYYLLIAAETALAITLYTMVGGFFFPYITNLLLDIALTAEPKKLPPLLVLILAPSLWVLAKPNTIMPLPLNVTVNLLVIGLTMLLGLYLQRESLKKEEAHVLYDKLRVSEEELQKAYAQLEGYSATVKELAVLRERNRISRELHDSVGHSISTLIIQLEAIKTASSSSKPEIGAMLGNLISYTRQAMENVRRTVRDMKPLELEDESGLLAIDRLLDTFKNFTQIDTQLIVSRERWPLTPEQSHNLYRITQEALNNSAKHSKATRIVVSFNFADDRLQVKVRDNGVGVAQLSTSFGLSGMKERVGALGGTLNITSAQGQGFEIFATIPREVSSFDQAINSG